MYQQNPKELEGVANLLATKGRYGDSMMVHMNPIEVEGLASLSPTGSLTVNPDTGQPEAFLPFLLPLLGGIGGSALAGTAATGLLSAGGLSATALGAIGSGLGSFAATGDLKQGLISGITGFGIGSALGGLGSAASDVVIDGTKEAAIQAANEAAKLGAAEAGAVGMTQSAKNALASSFQDQGVQAAGVLTKGAAFRPTVGQNLGKAFSKEGLKALTSPTALIGAGVGEGTNMQIRQQNALEQANKDAERAGDAQYERASAMLEQNQYDANLPPVPYEPASYTSNYGNYNQGGIVSIDPSDFQERFNGLLEMGAPIKGMNMGGMFSGINVGNYIDPIGTRGAAPAQRQAALRGTEVISPADLEALYDKQGAPGFGPEIEYFSYPQAAAPRKSTGEADGSPVDLSNIDFSGLSGFMTGINPVVSGIIASHNKGEISAEEMQEQIASVYKTEKTEKETASKAGAKATTNISPKEYGDYIAKYGNIDLSGIRFAEGGETSVSDEAAFMDRILSQILAAISGSLPPEEAEAVINMFIEEFGEEAFTLLEKAQSAILGELPPEEAEAVINMFIDSFGQDAFSSLRDGVLEQVVPNSQKEGEITGVGGGMDDLVGGMIGSQQPVAVSPGEYIVPADVVSGLGDGSTDSGVQELDGMLDRVRVERTNTTKQPAPLRRGGVLPA